MSRVKLLEIDDTEAEELTRWDITGYQLNRHLLSKALTGTGQIVLDHMTFPPGFIHHMHRHPYADMVIIPLSGVLQFLSAPGSPVDVSPGQILVIPRGNWHEIRNVSAADSRVLHFFSGVGAIENIGYGPFHSPRPAAGG
jgi:quercetin dioxygenase-like cupin family protein